MAVPLKAASGIVTRGIRRRFEARKSSHGEAPADADIEARIKAHAKRLWAESGRRGSPADYVDQARAIASREELPQEAESTG